MRLLLDEHYSPAIARQLRERGHDVVAVTERPGLTGRSDRLHFASMAGERRAIVTEDVGDFRPLLLRALRAGEPTFGLVCVSPRRFPRSLAGVGRLVAALDALLLACPREDAAIAAGGEIWLEEPAE